MTKKQRNKIYKQVLNNLSFDFKNKNFRVCIKLKEIVNPDYDVYKISELFEEFHLFKGE